MWEKDNTWAFEFLVCRWYTCFVTSGWLKCHTWQFFTEGWSQCTILNIIENLWHHCYTKVLITSRRFPYYMNELCKACMTHEYLVCNIQERVPYHFVGNSLLSKIIITGNDRCSTLVMAEKKPSDPCFVNICNFPSISKSNRCFPTLP